MSLRKATQETGQTTVIVQTSEETVDAARIWRNFRGIGTTGAIEIEYFYDVEKELSVVEGHQLAGISFHT